jgi:hypothetical protein
VAGARVYLTGEECQMLELLSLRKGTTLIKEMFLTVVVGRMLRAAGPDLAMLVGARPLTEMTNGIPVIAWGSNGLYSVGKTNSEHPSNRFSRSIPI